MKEDKEKFQELYVDLYGMVLIYTKIEDKEWYKWSDYLVGNTKGEHY